MFSPRRLSTLLSFLIFLGFSVEAFAQTFTFTPSRTPTSTRTDTPTRTLSSTPTNSPTPTITWTPNLTLTPLCGSGSFNLGYSAAVPGLLGSDNTNRFRASFISLSKPATLQTLWLYSSDINSVVMTGIYTGTSGSIGSLVAQSAPQTAYSGWNGFSMSQTHLAAGGYWLAYAYQPSSYHVYYNSTSTGVSVVAFTAGPVTFPTMPSAFGAAVSYGTNVDAIYVVFCGDATATPTVTSTPTNSPTQTVTFTPTNTGTILTFTPTLTATFTSTKTYTVTQTPTVTLTPSLTPTPNASLTPDCGAAATFFGQPVTTGAPQTFAPVNGMRAGRYTLTQSGTAETISYHLSTIISPVTVVVGLFDNSQSTTVIGNKLAQSTTQLAVTGWNHFVIPQTYLVPGDYWVALGYAGPVDFCAAIVPASTGYTHVNAFLNPLPSFTFPSNLGGVPVGDFWQDPVIINYCPGVVITSTPTSTPTQTMTHTITFTPTTTDTKTPTSTPTPIFSPTNTETSTPTGTPTLTATPTLSGTPTFSPTVTDTPTITPTFTATWTWTPTGTPTDTLTSTASFTPTSSGTPTGTPTLTPSWTSSSTPTLTRTFTSTGTSTPSSTLTDTPNLTWSPTSTPSVTLTSTPSSTATATLSSTPTYSNTPSGTPSSTPTSTKTFTQTATSTGTGTTTATASWTETWTPTLSPTATPSPTQTVTTTWTPTPGCSIAKSVSQNVANPNDILTYDIAMTVVGGPVTNLLVTDTLPSAMDLVGFGAVPPGGTTSWNASTKTLGWAIPVLGPGSYSITYQVQINSTAQAGQVLTNNAQLTYNGLSLPVSTSVNVAMAATAPVLYPNPIKDKGPAFLQVILAQPQENLEIKVFTTAFRKVYEDKVQNIPAGAFQYALDPARFEGGTAANGLYYVLLTTPSNRWVLKLLIIR